jgi:hypothetical protein
MKGKKYRVGDFDRKLRNSSISVPPKLKVKVLETGGDLELEEGKVYRTADVGAGAFLEISLPGAFGHSTHFIDSVVVQLGGKLQKVLGPILKGLELE